MRVKQRLELLDKIGRELQARYSYGDIDLFLSAFGVAQPTNVGVNSKWVYSKVALQSASDDVLQQIAQELDLLLPSMPPMGVKAPDCWEDDSQFRLFISHLAAEKLKAKRLKETLAPYHISGFVAHEDITPTLDWQKEIEKALFTMDAMVTLHTAGFSQSIWTQQEIGFALGRRIKVISLRIGEDPKGFISKDQALLRRGRDATGLSEEIASILTSDASTKARMAEVRAKHQQVEDDEIPF